MKGRKKPKAPAPTHLRAPLHDGSPVYGALCGHGRNPFDGPHPTTPNVDKVTCLACRQKYARVLAANRVLRHLEVVGTPLAVIGDGTGNVGTE